MCVLELVRFYVWENFYSFKALIQPHQLLRELS